MQAQIGIISLDPPPGLRVASEAMTISTAEIYGNETDAQLKAMAWQMFCHAHPVEAYQYDPDGFWEYFHKRAPKHTREEMVSLLRGDVKNETIRRQQRQHEEAHRRRLDLLRS